ncbi:MAG: glycosyltransferase [Magnetococcales bacterium]|nr:glycosyltransferase [Magnetococcales bacterium]
MDSKIKLLIFIVAYNAANTIQKVLARIPHHLFERYHVEILTIDDASHDSTFETALAATDTLLDKCTMTVLTNPINQGYGGNQKLGLHYAIQNQFDVVALLHGDGQYAPECLPDLVAPLAENQADMVLGSRMVQWQNALKGGMPLYKFIGNIILTTYQNQVLGIGLSEYHSGYRLYAVRALKLIPFHMNTQDFHFDTEIIIQMALAGNRIREIPIPTFYGDEICHVNGLHYAWNVIRVSTQAWAHRKGLSYQARYDLLPDVDGQNRYAGKLDFISSHTLAISKIPAYAKVLDIGCGEAYCAEILREKGCHVTGMDLQSPRNPSRLDQFIAVDIDQSGLSAFSLMDYDQILLLDVVEHLRNPEAFIYDLLQHRETKPDLRVIVSTGNVAFLPIRLGLLFGCFNYKKRGVLDITHTRLFTFASMCRLFEEQGCSIEEIIGVPAPFPLVFGNNFFSRFLLNINRALIWFSKSLFSYQILLVLRPRPTLQSLLRTAREFSHARAGKLDSGADSITKSQT